MMVVVLLTIFFLNSLLLSYKVHSNVVNVCIILSHEICRILNGQR